MKATLSGLLDRIARVKGKGEMTTYLLVGVRGQLPEGGRQ